MKPRGGATAVNATRDPRAPNESAVAPQVPAAPGSATYEVIRQRLAALGGELREGLDRLDARRREVFGSIEPRILKSDRIVTSHNCVPRDMTRIGTSRFLVGFNVLFGLKREVELGDVFAVYRNTDDGFHEDDLEVLADPRFVADFKRLYNVYERTVFSKFSRIEGSLYMVFRTGPAPADIAVFKWAVDDSGLVYVDGRAEAEYRKVGFSPSHPFRWQSPGRDAFRYGDHPHVSIEDRVFVECVGGDLTIKVEDNTATGEGLYSEPVEDRYQKVDDAEIQYAILNHLVLLRIRPYKEAAARHLIFNGKLQTVDRVDSIGHACARLPEDQGLIFPDGFYLATGGLKRFEAKEEGPVLERVIHAPNGEDSLYVFYSAADGSYALLPYQMIAQRVSERIVCHGFSIFPDGRLLLFRADPEPQKHHTVQLRQTPFHEKGHEPPGRHEAFLYQIGNRDVVRCLAECHEILALILRDEPYSELYVDLVRRCAAVLDSHLWLADAEAAGVDGVLRRIREAADLAVEEFDKVRRLQREAVRQVEEIRARCQEQFAALRRATFRTVDDHVVHLTALRRLRGELITLRDVRYVDVGAIDALEAEVGARAEELAQACVKFLVQPEALDPYRRRAAEHQSAAESVTKGADGRAVERAIAEADTELQMLVEVVGGLAIDDATETTRILDGITAVFATLNHAKAVVRKRLKELATSEGAAQFEARMKLLAQSAGSLLERCDSPEACDDALNRVSVQLEELEGAFADFDEYIVRIADRRAELHGAFEQRKLSLIEQRTRRAAALVTAAERILKVVQHRLSAMESVEAIHAHYASDPMVTRVRDTVSQLLDLGDPVRADHLDSRLKAARQEAIRQLHDRGELFEGGGKVIRLGRHRFNVNAQPLDLTVLMQEGVPCLHLTSTRYFEPITDEAYLATRDAWGQELLSEDSTVYRAEYLAHALFQRLAGARDHAGNGAPAGPGSAGVEQVAAMHDEQRLALVQEFITGRHDEGYAKGIHDVDAARILGCLAVAHVGLGLARHTPAARACAVVFWQHFCPEEARELWSWRTRLFEERNQLFPGERRHARYVAELHELLRDFIRGTRLYPEDLADPAAEYLFEQLTTDRDAFVLSRGAERLLADFRAQLVARGRERFLEETRSPRNGHAVGALELIRDWLRGFIRDRPGDAPFLEEAAAALFCGDSVKWRAAEAMAVQELDGIRGTHPRISGSTYVFDYLEFLPRLGRFEAEAVPRFKAWQDAKTALIRRERDRLRLEELKPRVLTSFVRNQLVDEAYLPLVGDNLAKQLGAAGDARRTDLMGLLLLISPPGYGKTTLLEYVASRLGLVFVKINGPALGHAVKSLDPEEAGNASAREEIQRLNLALEMGDNVMICVDDIQHCNPEFLQKFISLCDAQRKIEGVWRGRSRTYDLRGRKVAVVMAGNPYTESGQRFRLPDMLANRADTYNLGDIIGGRADWFRASYLENAVTSNPVLAPFATRGGGDIRAFIRIAEGASPETAPLDSSYSPQELEEIVAVMRRLVAVRDILLRVNQEYIHSAGQADEFRMEPPFRLQGSYRNMNRLAEKIVAIQNDSEIRELLLDHYRTESQTLTSGAEANFLKFKEIAGWLTPEESARWEEIKRTFRRNQVVRGGDDKDPVSRIVGQLAGFQAGLGAIQETLQTSLRAPALDLAPLVGSLESLGSMIAERMNGSGARADRNEDPATRFAESMAALRQELAAAVAQAHAGAMSDRVTVLSRELVLLREMIAQLRELSAQQRDHLRAAHEALAARARQGVIEFEVTDELLRNERAFLERFHQALAERSDASSNPDAS